MLFVPKLWVCVCACVRVMDKHNLVGVFVYLILYLSACVRISWRAFVCCDWFLRVTYPAANDLISRATPGSQVTLSIENDDGTTTPSGWSTRTCAPL